MPQASLSAEDRDQLLLLIGSRLNDAQRAWAPGFALVGAADAIVPLQPGTDHRMRVDLERGVFYRIISACDNECDNIDLELIDYSTGGVVAADLREDVAHSPIIDYTPAADGRYLVRILLQSCEVGPCYVGGSLLAFDTRAPSFEGVSLPAAAPRPFEGDYADELQLRPILDYLQERYGTNFSTFLDSASRIRANEELTTEIAVDGGEPQAFIGACTGCSNLDLDVIDKTSGATVASDTLPNNHPIVYYMPTGDGVLIARLRVHDCDSELCSAGVRILSGDVVLQRQ